jgi:elongation factor G
VQGRHKKQTGGRGQFGDCKCVFEPLPRGGGFVFEDKIFGGSVPQQFRPAIEKGIVEAAKAGAIAGYPLVDFKVQLVDGSYPSGRLRRAFVPRRGSQGVSRRRWRKLSRRCWSR